MRTLLEQYKIFGVCRLLMVGLAGLFYPGWVDGQTTRVAEVQIMGSQNDAEENLSTGVVQSGSGDLELVEDQGESQLVGLRFDGLSVPQGALIERAYIQFVVDETGDEPTELLIYGESSAHALPFNSRLRNLSERDRTQSEVRWEPRPWVQTGGLLEDTRTSDLAEVVQEIVDHPDWLAGNALAIFFIGEGRRTAEAYDLCTSSAPLLHVEYFSQENLSRDFIAYNDLSWSLGQLSENITRYTTEEGAGVPPDGSRGTLIDFGSGETVPVLLEVTGGLWDGRRHPNFGRPASVGTDAHILFHGKVDPTGVVTYSRKPLTLTFNGLDPDRMYEVAVFGNRGNEAYADRLTTTRIAGVEAFENHSSTGANFSGSHDETTIIAHGSNTAQGLVAKYTNIAAGLDGRFQLIHSGGSSTVAARFYLNAVCLRTLPLKVHRTPEPLLNASFDAGNDDFEYSDDAFRSTSQPAYASGHHDERGGIRGGGLVVTLGGRDNEDILGMSGGWRRFFEVKETTDLWLTFRAKLILSRRYNQGEYGEILVSLDHELKGLGEEDFVSRLEGLKERCRPETAEWRSIRIRLTDVHPGQHELVLGGYQNKKTVFNEFTYLLFDDVRLFQPEVHTLAVETRVLRSSDDAEEDPNGRVKIESGDLELVEDEGITQTIGLRFDDLQIPQGSAISHAYVQFTPDESDDVPTQMAIEGEASDEAPSFSATSGNITLRPRTLARVPWRPRAWSNAGGLRKDYRTPNLSSIVQEVVGRRGWKQGNPLVLIISGIGRRTADAYDVCPFSAPMLHVEYETITSSDLPLEGKKVLFLDTFDQNALPYQYLDDPFQATRQPAYASGAYDSTGGYVGGGLVVELGGRDNEDIVQMSGGWQRRFSLSESAETWLTLRYQIILSRRFNEGETGRVWIRLDDDFVGGGKGGTLLQVSGRGDRCGNEPSGWVQQEIPLGRLSKGVHLLTLGGSLNKKTVFNEFTYILFDDVSVRTRPFVEDRFEEDNRFFEAYPIELHAPQEHNFHTPKDQDWVRISLLRDRVYRFKTTQLGATGDTVLDLFAESVSGGLIPLIQSRNRSGPGVGATEEILERSPSHRDLLRTRAFCIK